MLMSLILRLVPILILPFLAFALVARALGGAGSSSLALAGFTTGCESKPQPCWYGMSPHITPVLDAQTTLTNLGYRVRVDHAGILSQLVAEHEADRNCKVYSTLYDNRLTTIEILTCDSLYLADLIDQFGLPDVARVCNFYTYAQVYISLLDMDATLNPVNAANAFRLSSYDTVGRISLDAPPADVPEPKWFGFVPFWRYQQLKGSSVDC